MIYINTRSTINFCLSTLLVSALFVFDASHAQGKIEVIEVTTTGYGKDNAAATFDALDSAVAQVTGSVIGSEITTDLRQQVKNGSSTITEDFKQNISKLTKGVVKSYSVLETTKDKDSGQIAVKIVAQVPRYEQSSQLKRLRLAVMPISLSRSLINDSSAIQFAERLSAASEAYLTQSRRFAVLDRRSGNAIDKEQNYLRSAEMPIEELVKTNAAVGTDYLVLTVVKDFSSKVEIVTRPNGRQMERLNMPVTVDVRVIDIASRQIKFAQTYNHKGRVATGKTLQLHAYDIAQEIGETIVNAIYPIAVIAAEGKSLTLNQGGVTVKSGKKYKLIKLGAPLIDPYTKESLGRQESEVGVIQITNVTAQQASAKLVSGSEEILAAGDLLVRPMSREAEENYSSSDSDGAQSMGEGRSKKKSDDSDW